MITRWPTWTPACSGTPPPAHPQRDPVVVDDRTSGRLERSSCRGLGRPRAVSDHIATGRRPGRARSAKHPRLLAADSLNGRIAIYSGPARTATRFRSQTEPDPDGRPG